MLLARLVETSNRVAGTTKRLEKIDLLAGLLRQVEPAEVEIAVSYLAGSVRQGRIGIGYAAIQDATGATAPEASLSLREVDETFSTIANTKGAGSAGLKLNLLGALLGRATGEEQHFLARLVVGELRQGALEGILVEAVARAAELPAATVRRATMFAGDLAVVAKAASTGTDLSQFGIQLFRPMQPMLAQPADNIEAALEELGEAALEYKMDGARIQVHKSGDEVRVYSRRLKEVTAAVPEVVELALELPTHELILDGEVIALQDDGRPHPFQVTMRRFGRKLDVDKMRSSLPLTPFWFDILHLDGGELIDEPQSDRFAALSGLVPTDTLIPHITTATGEVAGHFLEQAIGRGHEGIMAKSIAAPYEAGGRGQSWLKVKPTHTLDLVVLAAEWGSGRRRGWLSNLHLGARDPDAGGFVMLGKTFKGLTDKVLAWQTEELLKIEIGRDKYTVFVEPKLVVEIAFNELQASPRYPGGLALRFARVKRYRLDKTAAEADTIQTVRQLA